MSPSRMEGSLRVQFLGSGGRACTAKLRTVKHQPGGERHECLSIE